MPNGNSLFEVPQTDAEFDRFWNAYPRKVAKKEARKAWMQTAKIRPSLPVLLSALAQHKRSKQWQDWTLIPHASTWLRGERWDDVGAGSAESVSARIERQAEDDKRQFAQGAERIARDPEVARRHLAQISAMLRRRSDA